MVSSLSLASNNCFCFVIFHGGATASGVATERILLAHWALFIIQNLLYNTLFKPPATKCTYMPHAGIGVWYYILTKTLMDQGIYVHLFWCFRKSIPGYWGFEAADAHSAGLYKDLPDSMKTPFFPNDFCCPFSYNEGWNFL